jgi:hypothetical protein
MLNFRDYFFMRYSSLNDDNLIIQNRNGVLGNQNKLTFYLNFLSHKFINS